jgi:peptidoglycan-associated lipoprotein
MVPPGITVRAAEGSLVRVASQAPWILVSSKGVNISGIDFFEGGLKIERAENVAVSKCGFAVREKKPGLVVVNSKAVSVIRSSFVGKAGTVGVLAGGSNVSITDSFFRGHGTAIVFADGVRGDVQNNLFEENASGILASNSELTAVQNIITGVWDPDSKDEHLDVGIRLERSAANLTKNSIRRHRYGIMLLSTPGPARIMESTLTQGQHGIVLLGSPATVTGNLITENQGNGIYVGIMEKEPQAVPQEVKVLRNTISENEGDGVLVENFSHVSLRENLVEANGTGIRLVKSVAAIENNTIVLQRSIGLKVGAHSDAEIYNNILASNAFGLSLDVTARREMGYNDSYGNLARTEFPLLDGNYSRVDRYVTRDSKKVLIAVYPAYDLKVESDMSVDPAFISLGSDYHLKRDSDLAGIRGREHRYIGAYPPAGVAPARWPDELFEIDVQDAFFDYDSSELRPDAEQTLRKIVEFLRSYPQTRVSIEGHCDERGSTEYNLALGDRRARTVKSYLEMLGVSSDRMETTSWGKERPFCRENNETCWQQNRRAHFMIAQ